MLRFMITLFILAIFVLSSPAGVIKETKSSVRFAEFGDYITKTTTKIQDMQRLDQSDNEFKGKGLMGNITARFILKPGSSAEWVNLPEMQMYSMDHKRKEYRVRPIEKVKLDRLVDYDEEEKVDEYDQPESETSSTIQITRNEFKVDVTGEKKTINNFPSQKYVAIWIVEWEDTETNDKGKDSLQTIIWTTPMSDDLKQAQEEEMRFNREYLTQMGLDMETIADEVLGTRWMHLFRQLSRSRTGQFDDETPQFVQEMEKIEGYPVLTDGKYFFTREGESYQTTAPPEKEEEEKTEINPRDPRGTFGGLMKKAIKKKVEPKKETTSASGPLPAFSFYTEVLSFKAKSLNPADFGVPAGYKKIEAER